MPDFQYKKFRFAFTLEYSHGGDKWNGTRAFLDYLSSSAGLVENTRTHYGEAGVGEEYMEKATYLRMKQIDLSYELFYSSSHFIRSLRIGANIQNLFLITPYKGVDPSSLLFGYSSGMGLDLFNQPSTRNYSLTLTLEL